MSADLPRFVGGIGWSICMAYAAVAIGRAIIAAVTIYRMRRGLAKLQRIRVLRFRCGSGTASRGEAVELDKLERWLGKEVAQCCCQERPPPPDV